MQRLPETDNALVINLVTEVLELLAIERDEEQEPMLLDRLLGSEKPTEWSLVSEGVDRELRFENVSLQFISSGQTVVGDLCIGPHGRL